MTEAVWDAPRHSCIFTVQITHFSAQRQQRGFTATEECKFSLQEVKDLTQPPLDQRNTEGCSTRELFLRGWGFAGKSHLANLQPEYIFKIKIFTGNWCIEGCMEQDTLLWR